MAVIVWVCGATAFAALITHQYIVIPCTYYEESMPEVLPYARLSPTQIPRTYMHRDAHSRAVFNYSQNCTAPLQRV